MNRVPAIENGRLGEQDIHLFREGTHGRLYRRFGCTAAGGDARFAVWAPNAQAVSVIGDFNGWQRDAAPAKARSDDSRHLGTRAVWRAAGQAYKFAIRTAARAMAGEGRPVRALRRMPARDRLGGATRAMPFDWHDAQWMAQRAAKTALDAPIVDLRGASGLVAPRRATAPCSATASSAARLAELCAATWASRTSSCCP